LPLGHNYNVLALWEPIGIRVLTAFGHHVRSIRKTNKDNVDKIFKLRNTYILKMHEIQLLAGVDGN
jgi:hypothetical protein